MAKRLALSFTRFGQMPTTRPAIKEVVEVGALFVTNLFHGNDAAGRKIMMVMMITMTMMMTTKEKAL